MPKPCTGTICCSIRPSDGVSGEGEGEGEGKASGGRGFAPDPTGGRILPDPRNGKKGAAVPRQWTGAGKEISEIREPVASVLA